MGALTWTSLRLSFSVPPPNPLLLLLLLATLLLCTYYYYNYYHEKGAASRHGGRALPSGSLGLLLGLGESLHFLVGSNCPMDSPRPFLSSRLRKYGTIFKTHLLGQPTVISMDPTLNKLLLSGEGKLVRSAFPSFMKKIIGPNTSLHGEAHHQLREVMKAVLSANAIQSIHFTPIQEYACNFLHSWANMGVRDTQRESQKFIFMYTLKFLLNLAPGDPNALWLLNEYDILLKFQSSIPLDVPGTTFNKAVKARNRIFKKISELVNARRKVMGAQIMDFTEIITKYNNTITNEEIVDLILPFIIAAVDTTSTLLTNVFKFLSENPHVVDELQKEHAFIRENKKENELLTWDDLKLMQFTKCVIKETLRITNIAEFVPREALQDIIFQDMVIPKGWRILVNFSVIHLNPSIYEDPCKFDPWRWQDNRKTNNQAFFTPFSGGMRMCLGPLLAEVKVSIFLHYLLTRYKWHAVRNKDKNREIVSGHFMSKMEGGIPIKIAPI